MTPDEYWKNFSLGAELEIAGRFIYNGLHVFHEMESFHREEDSFEFLYAVSVGIERLLKIAIILTEHDRNVDQDDFEKALITHSHQKLVERVRGKHPLELSPVQNEFISILARFYRSQRYGRYSLTSVRQHSDERDDLNAFLSKHLSVEIDTESFFAATRNDRRFKKFVGKVVSKIVLPLYEVVQSEARRLNIYTYEIEVFSKAYKIFIDQTFDFENEDILQTELLAYFLSKNATGANAKFLRDEVGALSFDPALEPDYIDALRNERKKQKIMGELEVLYEEEVDNFRERRDMLDAARSSYLDYCDEDAEFENDEELDTYFPDS